jgi:hypothetical protein
MFYAFGAALCIINTYGSIAFIVAVQLYYALAPRLPGQREHPGDELRSA